MELSLLIRLLREIEMDEHETDMMMKMVARRLEASAPHSDDGTAILDEAFVSFRSDRQRPQVQAVVHPSEVEFI